MVRTHKYTDISHFRAPYKNWVSLGAVTGAPVDDEIIVDPDGVAAIQPAVLQTYLGRLAQFSVIFLDNDSVQLAPVQQGDPRENAVVWGNRKLAEGKTVVLQSPSGVGTLLNPPPGAVYYMRSGSGRAFEKEAATVLATPDGQRMAIGAILAKPGGLAKASLLGPVGIVVGVVGVGALAYLAFSKPKRAAKNGRRRAA